MKTKKNLIAPALLGISSSLPSSAFSRPGLGEERLLGVEVKADSISFKVETGGCTKKSHFGLETIKLHPLTVRLVRIRPDFCEGLLPSGTNIHFSYAEIGAGPTLKTDQMTQVVVINPVLTNHN